MALVPGRAFNRWRLLLALGACGLLILLAALLLRPDPRTAWQQAALTRGLPEETDPLRQTAWREGVRQLLSEADALGPRPTDPARQAGWLQAQCRINQRLQALQRQQGRPVESAAVMGRPAACEALAAGAPGWQPSAAGKPAASPAAESNGEAAVSPSSTHR